MAKDNQTERVLARLRKGPLTQMEALVELGVMRLGARILELREQGHDIATETIEDETRDTGKPAHVARYRLPECQHAWVAQSDGFGSRRCSTCGLVTAPKFELTSEAMP